MTFAEIKPIISPERPAGAEGNFYSSGKKSIGPGMNERIQHLRKQSVETAESLSIERALITTKFYKENYGKYSEPVMRALNFLEICKRYGIHFVIRRHCASYWLQHIHLMTTEAAIMVGAEAQRPH